MARSTRLRWTETASLMELVLQLAEARPPTIKPFRHRCPLARAGGERIEYKKKSRLLFLRYTQKGQW